MSDQERSPSGHRLVVMRHARAEPFAPSDHERRLTDRGRAAAREAGDYLRRLGLVPDTVLVSSATRTRETWSEVARALGESSAVSFDDAWFTGSPDVVLGSLRELPEDAVTAMFVGHNPTAAYLCHLLDDGQGDPDAVTGLLHGFPPCAVAVLELSTSWADLAAETARLTAYHVGGQ
jgi:phosphohistidine phosphatase